MIVQILQHLQVICAGGMAAVDELHQQGMMPGSLKIAVDEVIPALTVRIADLGIAIAGQIHKIAVVHLIEVDGGRFARCTGYTGKVLAVAQLVDEAGLAHVGTA